LHFWQSALGGGTGRRKALPPGYNRKLHAGNSANNQRVERRRPNGIVWGPPLMILLVGAGILLTVVTGGIQFRRLALAFREVLGKLLQKNTGSGSVTPFQALATALASTVGVGQHCGGSDGNFPWRAGGVVLVAGFRPVRHGDEVF
jgi:hypothetical protein